MIIGVNTRFLLKNKLEGLGRFSDEVLKRLVLAHPEHTFHFFFDRPFDARFIYASNVKPHIVYPPARHPFLYILWFEMSVPILLRKLKCDIFLSPDGFLSLKSAVPSVAVIHDIAFEHYPALISGIGAKYYRYFFPRFAKKAIRIATVSEFTKLDLITKYQIKPSVIDVVFNGVSEAFSPLDAIQNQKTREQFTGGKAYFLYVGALHPRKNIERLIKAFEIFKLKNNDSVKLLIVGRNAWKNKLMEATYQNCKFKDDIHFTGYINDFTLTQVYAAAYALTYVPIFEGFGLPLIEAFRCGVPAITSMSSSMPEVSGHAAILVNPNEVEEIAQAMINIWNNKKLRDNLSEHALVRAQDFTWDKTANLVWNSIEKAVAMKK